MYTSNRVGFRARFFLFFSPIHSWPILESTFYRHVTEMVATLGLRKKDDSLFNLFIPKASRHVALILLIIWYQFKTLLIILLIRIPVFSSPQNELELFRSTPVYHYWTLSVVWLCVYHRDSILLWCPSSLDVLTNAPAFYCLIVIFR